MGKIFYIMGKSASGKDTIYQRIRNEIPELKTIVLYTTRPIRQEEQEGREYHFVSDAELIQYQHQGIVIECRSYQTVQGLWRYFTLDDGQFNLKSQDYLMIGTLESYESMKSYFGSEYLVPLYITIDPGIRLERALARERNQTAPDYQEICRRFLADEEDFSEENKTKSGVSQEFDNSDLEQCIYNLKKVIREQLNC